MGHIIDEMYVRAANAGFDLGQAIDRAAEATALQGKHGIAGSYNPALADALAWVRANWQTLVPDITSVRRGELYEDEDVRTPEALLLVLDLVRADYEQRAVTYRYGSFNRAMLDKPVPPLTPNRI